MNARILTLAALLAAAAANATAQEEPPPARFTITGFTVEGANPLPAERTEAILADYAGEHEGLDGLLAAADALESAILKAGYSFRRVILPPQTLAEDVVALRVVEFDVGQVAVQGQEHFTEAQVRRSLPSLAEGTVPSTRELARDLRVANRHPDRQVSLRFKEAEGANAIDAEVTVTDDRPWEVVAGLNNTGTPDTERLRASVAFQHSNVFQLDHVLTLSHTTAPGDLDGVRQTGLHYRVPFYDRAAELVVFYVDSSVDTGVVDGFDVTGSGRFWGVSWEHQLLRVGRYNHWMSVGLQNKFFDSDIEDPDTGEKVLDDEDTDIRSVPLLLSYGGDLPYARGNLFFSASWARNITVGSQNEQSNYDAQGADVDWDRLRVRTEGTYALPREWSLRGILEGQYADQRLIAQERFGLGGVNSVRGLEERDVAGDEGIRGTLELWTPMVAPNTRFLGFLDFGRVYLNERAPGEKADDGVVTTGLGARWQPYPDLSLAFDLGHVLEGTRDAAGEVQTRDGHNKLHVNILMKF